MKIVLSVDSWCLLVSSFTQHFKAYEMLYYPNLCYFLEGLADNSNSWPLFDAYILLLQNACHVPYGTLSPMSFWFIGPH